MIISEGAIVQEEQPTKEIVRIDDCWNRIGVWSRAAERCPELTRFIHCRNCPTYSSAGRRMLNRPATQEYRQEWAKILAEGEKRDYADTQSAFIFRAGTEWLGLASYLIREVVDMGSIHSLPHMSDQILRGVVNIRGKLEVCVSIGGVLGIEREEGEPSQSTVKIPERLIVAIQESKVVTFPVSEVMGVVRFRPDAVKDLPVTVSGAKAYYTKGILCLDGRDIGLLKDKPLFRTLTKDLA